MSRRYRAVRSLLVGIFIIMGLVKTLPAQIQHTIPGLYWYNDLNYIRPETFQYPDTLELQRTLRVADSIRFVVPDSSIRLATWAYHQSKAIHYTQGIVHALNSIGIALQQKGMYDSSIIMFRQALPYTKNMGRRYPYRLYSNISTSYFNLGQYEAYLENAFEALKAMKKNDPQFTYKDSIALYANIGYVWTSLGVGAQAFAFLETVREIAERKNDTTKLGAIYARIGFAHLTEGNIATGITYLHKGLETAKRYRQVGSQIENLNTLAHFYIDEQNMDMALQYTREAIQLLAQYPDKYQYDRFHTRHNLGCIYLKKKEYAKAELLLVPTLNEAKALNQKDIIPHMESDVAALYAATGRHQLAYDHMLHYSRMKDSIFEQQRTKSLDLWLKTQDNEKDKAMIAQKLQISQQQKKLQAKNFWIGGTAFGSLLLLTAFVALMRNYRSKQRLQQVAFAQLQQEQEINQLKAQVRGEEQERNRIAMELHDGIASQLWAIKLNVDSLQQQNNLHDGHLLSLQSIYQQLDNTTQEVRKTAHNLMPDLLLEEGLGAALASFCERIKKQTDLEVDFLEYGHLLRMDEEIELSLYRMIQELIQNVLKHASGATQLLVQLSCTDALLNITVEDNGAGFTENNPDTNKGIGLRHIEKRVKAMNGHIDLQSTPGKGTTVYLEFDIQNLL